MRLKLMMTAAAMIFTVGCAQGAPTPDPTANPQAARAVATASPVVAAAVEASPIKIAGVNVGQTDTTITLRNEGSTALTIGGWELRVGNESVTLPSQLNVAPGQTVTLHTASGASTGNDVFLGDEAANLLSALRPGANVTLVNDRGNVVSEFVLPTA